LKQLAVENAIAVSLRTLERALKPYRQELVDYPDEARRDAKTDVVRQAPSQMGAIPGRD
jgi:hypothetical protein